jgi:cyclopropane fatty-acyl-phospholipid synthase-like methyltransferase
VSVTPAPEWVDVVDHIKGFFPAVAVVAAMQLDVFTPLSHGPKTHDELASALDVPPRRLRLLLRSLVATKLVAADGDRFTNSPVAEAFLVRGRPTYMGGSHELYNDLFAAVLPTARSVRTGVPQSHHEWESMPEDQLRAALRGLNVAATAQGARLAKEHDFARFKTILDVGGGGGGFSIGACQACPNLTAHVVELPRVARICGDLITAAGLGSRVRAYSHDLTVAPLPELHEVAVLRNLLQVLSPERAKTIVHNVGRSLSPGGEIYIIGSIVDDDGRGPSGSLALNLFFLNAFEDGEAYMESQYREWLEAAGFEEIRRSVIRGGLDLSLMTARKRR